MANLPISGLPAGSALAGTEPFPAVQSATTVKITATQIKTFTSNAPTFTGVAAFDAGAAALPSIIPTGDTNTGFWFPAADTIAASTGGTERVRIDSSGRVGIGTASPSFSLDIGTAAARIRINPSDATSNAYFNASNAGGNAYIGLDNSTAGLTAAYALNIYHTGAYPVVFSTNSNERMRITPTGNVGIGTTNPSSKLHVDGVNFRYGNSASYTADEFVIQRVADGVNLSVRQNTAAMFLTNDLERMRITSVGNVGIGTSSPGYPLDVSAAANATIRLTLAASHNVTMNAVAGGAFTIGVDGSGGTTERMRITSAGNVGIGTTSPGGKLDVAGTSNDAVEMRVTNSVNTGQYLRMNCYGPNGSGVPGWDNSSVIEAVAFGGSTTGTRGLYLGAYNGPVIFATGSSSRLERMRITASGNVGIGTDTPTALLHVNGDTIRVTLAKTPASATATGNAGDICWDANYVYVCTATNTWKRAAIATW